MSQPLLLNGKEYVSSKSAAQSSGYAQDYIGQLARGGLIDAERVGGLWYVSMDSLLGYKRNADTIKPIPPQAPAQPYDSESVVSFDGKDYISASRAAKLTGYHQDYVGQLARKGSILSRQIGNRWYVDREGLLSHKSEKDRLLAVVQREAVGLAHRSTAEGLTLSSPVRKEVPTYTPTPSRHANTTPLLTYSSDERDLFPNLRTSEPEIEAQPHSETTSARPVAIRNVSSIPYPPEIAKMTSYKAPKPARSGSQAAKMAGRAAIALTIVVVLGYGITYLKDSSIYASLKPQSSLTVSETSYAAAVWQAIDFLGESFEGLIAPEMIYERK